jgi:hypothetical protein
VPRVVCVERVIERRAQDRVNANDAGAEVAYAAQPAIVVGARRGHLPRLPRGHRRAEIDAGPEKRDEAVLSGGREGRPLHARWEREPADLSNRERRFGGLVCSAAETADREDAHYERRDNESSHS